MSERLEEVIQEFSAQGLDTHVVCLEPGKKLPQRSHPGLKFKLTIVEGIATLDIGDDEPILVFPEEQVDIQAGQPYGIKVGANHDQPLVAVMAAAKDDFEAYRAENS